MMSVFFKSFATQKSHCVTISHKNCLVWKANLTCWQVHRGAQGTSICHDIYSGTTNIKHTLSCTRSSKIVLKGVFVPYLGTAGRRAWPKNWEGPLNSNIICTQQQYKTTPARVNFFTYDGFWALNRSQYTTHINYCTSLYSEELRLSRRFPSGNLPQLTRNMSTKCKTHHTCRHWQGTRRQVQGTQALIARASRGKAHASKGKIRAHKVLCPAT